MGRKLLGRDVILFREANGMPRALGARCPHRGADLGQGAVVDDAVQCPFHGWRFDGAGRCVRVPSQPASVKLSSHACVPSFRVRECQGVLWIWTGNGDHERCAPPESPGPLEPPTRATRRLCFPAQLIDAPFLTMLESLFDKAHIPFIHGATFGAAGDPTVCRQRVTVDPSGHGLRAVDDPDSPWQAAPKLPRGWLGWVARLLGLRAPIAQHVRFQVPGVAEAHLEYPNHSYDRFLTYVTPADDEHTWLFVESVRTRAPHVVGDWIQRRAIEKVLHEGRRETRVILDAEPGDVLPRISVESDRVGLAARRLYERWANSEERTREAS